MASMAYSISYHYNPQNTIQPKPHQSKNFPLQLRIFSCKEEHQQNKPNTPINRREIILRSSELATLGAIFHFSGTKPSYLGVQKNPPSLALCPATKNCISTSENSSDLAHYAPPWNYNPEAGRGGKKPVTREEAMQELLDVLKSTKPDKFTPKIMEKKDDYVRVEYESPILGFVDDVEFWFPTGKKSIVEYRSASRLGNFDFDVNRKRIKALRQELEKKGWASENTY
ncbi:Polyphenol oxidase A1 chloroplastic [Bienertia sinuspersici]